MPQKKISVLLSAPASEPKSVNSYEPLLTKQEVAARLRQTPQTIYSLCRRRCVNPLPSIKVGKTLLFRWSQIERWLSEQERTA